jgi:hypothetical protein
VTHLALLPAHIIYTQLAIAESSQGYIRALRDGKTQIRGAREKALGSGVDLGSCFGSTYYTHLLFVFVLRFLWAFLKRGSKTPQKLFGKKMSKTFYQQVQRRYFPLFVLIALSTRDVKKSPQKQLQQALAQKRHLTCPMAFVIIHYFAFLLSFSLFFSIFSFLALGRSLPSWS